MTAKGGIIAGVDVGGTFTDLVLFDPEGGLNVYKVPSTPEDQSDGVVGGLAQGIGDLAGLARIDHGTTVSTNTLLEHTGAKVALITTSGFRDVLEIGRTRRMLPSVYDPTFRRPQPLVPRPLRFEVAERLDQTGAVLVTLDGESVDAVGRKLRRNGVQALAVCFLHAYANPEHERRALDSLAEVAPNLALTASHLVVPEFREYERFSTTVANAYLLPVMTRYLSTLGGGLAARGYQGAVHTMGSNGGTMDLETTKQLPIRTILSGPVGGVSGATWVGAAAGVANFVTYDMGGTSTDVCLIEDGRPAMVNETAFIGYPIKGRQIDINTVGAGGGSIAYAENGDTLKVGPRSAGARPGPACYGHGGSEPTVTDANMVLGRIGDRRLGGTIIPDVRLAQAAVGSLAKRLGVDDSERMADGIVRLAVAQMASAIREITVERGYDPADFVLMPFGGAGPMHATILAEEIGMSEVLVPIHPGNLSALGLLASDQVYEAVRTHLARLDSLDLDGLLALRDAHVANGRTELAGRGFPDGRMRFTHALDMRFARQAFEIIVEIPDDAWSPAALRRTFLETYEKHFGHAGSDGEIEIVNVRTRIIGVTRKPEIKHLRRGKGALADALKQHRRAWFDGAWTKVPVYEREQLPVETAFQGPAIVEEDGSTTVISPGWHGRRDRQGNLRLTAAQRK
jgi:N-methylhydantoinase A